MQAEVQLCLWQYSDFFLTGDCAYSGPMRQLRTGVTACRSGDGLK